MDTSRSTAITGPDLTVDLPLVRRLAALGFRSWPAATTTFDGTWAIRLTAGNPTNRQNSVNPLDPGDVSKLDERIDRTVEKFQAFGRAPVFLLSPLAPRALDDELDGRGWAFKDASVVMLGQLDEMDLAAGLDTIPLADAGRWLDAQVRLGMFPAERRPGVAETLAAIRPHAQGANPIGSRGGPVQLHTLEDASGTPIASLAAIRFGPIVGLFQIVTSPERRREGHARRLVASVLANALRDGATQAWLQVERANVAAIGLYEAIGFREVYGYHYRKLLI